jgi:hypothetical protein
MMQSDYKHIKLELDALRSRQEKSEVLMRDLRDELMQSSEDIRKSFILNEQQVNFPKRSFPNWIPVSRNKMLAN